jgi:hypothetical protein
MANEALVKAIGGIIALLFIAFWVLEVVLVAWNLATGVYDKFAPKALAAMLDRNTTNTTLVE